MYGKGRRSLAYWNSGPQRIHSPVLRYGFSVVTVVVALGVAFALVTHQSATWNCRTLSKINAFTIRMRDLALPCWLFYCPRSASTTSLLSRFTPSTFPLEIYLTFSFSLHGRQLSPRSVLFDAESRTAFARPATTFRSRWNSAGAERTKFADSIRNSANGLRNSKRPTRNWNLLPIPSPTTCGRHFATWSDTLSRAAVKTGICLCSTRRSQRFIRDDSRRMLS